ncbi:MAG: response regulator [Elusimicrobia bacterium]|nr:response regulator [Elusimicrobiota bacterium]
MNKDSRPVRVLLIEDDPDDVAIIEHFLSTPDGWGSFELKCVDRLAAGCRALEQERFDAVLLDLVLPGGVGIEAFLKIRQQRPEVPVVVLTGLRDESLALQAMRMGAQDYLIKGTIDDRLLKRALRYAIERSSLLAQVECVLNKETDAKLLIDHEGLIRYANPAVEGLLGRNAADWLGKPFPYPLPGTESSETRIGPQGAERVLELRCVEIDWAGRPARLLTVRDVTQLKKVEQLQNEVRERMMILDLKNEFMSSVSHELRNPLTTVRTAIQTLRDGLVGPMTPQQKRFIELAYRNVERQVKIINNILDLARLQSGRARLELRRVEIGAIVEEAIQGLSLSPRQKPRLETSLSAELPELYADPELLMQVLVNLLDNALRYARERVIVRAAAAADAQVRGGRGVTISVIDDGPGISEAHLEKLFTKFVQVNRTAGPSGYKGTGLGLAICKEIVTALGGRIWADSVLGKGSRFHFTIPTFAAAAPQLETAGSAPRQS